MTRERLDLRGLVCPLTWAKTKYAPTRTISEVTMKTTVPIPTPQTYWRAVSAAIRTIRPSKATLPVRHWSMAKTLRASQFGDTIRNSPCQQAREKLAR